LQAIIFNSPTLCCIQVGHKRAVKPREIWRTSRGFQNTPKVEPNAQAIYQKEEKNRQPIIRV